MEQHTSHACASSSRAHRDDGFETDAILQQKHKVFLGHSGFQKTFVEHLSLELEGCFQYPFFDKRRESLAPGENFPQRIFEAIQQCQIGVVILSEEFITSKWPMMELAAMYNRVLDETENQNFKIIPVFLHTSVKQFDDPVNWSRWQSCWHELAAKYPNRVQVEKWEAALKYLRSIKGLVYDRVDEIRFQNEIVDEICRAVPPEIKFQDSYIQGKSRLCKVIWEKVDMLQKNKSCGVCVIGLYGVGGVGKTTICKALCNDSFTKFRGRVHYAELEKGSEKELLRGLLKSLTNISPIRFDGYSVDQLQYALKEGSIKEQVFLVLDNMSDNDNSILQVKSYLSSRLPPGSIVMVVARSKQWLTRVRPYITEDNCLEMPNLKFEEAKSLFIKSSDFEFQENIDEELIVRCIKQCYFQKNDGNGGHYHPLALDVLGRQLAKLDDPKEWALKLDRISEDIFNHSKQNKHPIFAILRTSFDTLSREDQLLFMDIALFLPDSLYQIHWNVFKWLRIVHKMPREDDLKRALERLTMKSVLVRVGNGVDTRIGVHDLWRSFCVEETKYGELSHRRWIYDVENSRDFDHIENCPPGTRWENIKRMAFMDFKLKGLQTVNFAYFSNVTVLKIWGFGHLKNLVVDLSELINLKSLEVWERLPLKYAIIIIPPLVNRLTLQGLPKNLIFLRLEWEYAEECALQELMKEIACLQKLEYLHLHGFGGSELPDLTNMTSLHVAIFERCVNIITISGLSSQLRKLRVLVLKGCTHLRNCPGVGDLVALEILHCKDCIWLLTLPNLQKLKYLKILDISSCNLICNLPGLDDLVSLKVLKAARNMKLDLHGYIEALPDMCKLKNLQKLDLSNVWLGAISGIDNLISLRTLLVDLRKVEEKPSLKNLTNLTYLGISGLSLIGLSELNNLVMLNGLELAGNSVEVDELPELQNLQDLQFLGLSNTTFKDLSSLNNMGSLERLIIIGCGKFERLPNLQGLTKLKLLQIKNCAMLRNWDHQLLKHVKGKNICLTDNIGLQNDLLDSQGLMDMLTVREDFSCFNLSKVAGNGVFSELEELVFSELPILEELPDLGNFPQLKTLQLLECANLRRLTSREPMVALSTITLSHCSKLTTLPNLCKFPALCELKVIGCDGITILNSIVPLSTLKELSLEDCNGIKDLPNLEMFPALKTLKLKNCTSLKTLSTNVPLLALRSIDITGCTSFIPDNLDQIQAFCNRHECNISNPHDDIPERRPHDDIPERRVPFDSIENSPPAVVMLIALPRRDEVEEDEL